MRRAWTRPVSPLVAVAAAPALAATGAGDQDPLPSWNDGAAREAIVEFVRDVTDRGGPSFVPPDARIATFDNDGTLWAEQPMYVQLLFALDRVKALAPQHPEWHDRAGKPVGIPQHIGRRPTARSATRTATGRCSSGRWPVEVSAS